MTQRGRKAYTRFPAEIIKNGGGWVPVKALAKKLHWSPLRLYRAIRQGQLESCRGPGGLLYVPKHGGRLLLLKEREVQRVRQAILGGRFLSSPKSSE